MTTATINPVEVTSTESETTIKVKTTMIARIKSAVSSAYNSVKTFVVGLVGNVKAAAIYVAKSVADFGRALVAGFWMVGAGTVDMVASWMHRAGCWMAGSKIKLISQFGVKTVRFARAMAAAPHATFSGRVGAAMLGYGSMCLVSLSLLFTLAFASFVIVTEKVNEKSIRAVSFADNMNADRTIEDVGPVAPVATTVQVVDAVAGEPAVVMGNGAAVAQPIQGVSVETEDTVVVGAVRPEVRNRRANFTRQLRSDVGNNLADDTDA